MWWRNTGREVLFPSPVPCPPPLPVVHRLSLDSVHVIFGKICVPLPPGCEEGFMFQQPVQGGLKGASAATCRQRCLGSVGELSCSVLCYLRCNTSSGSEKPLCMDMTIFQVLGYDFATEGWELEKQNTLGVGEYWANSCFPSDRLQIGNFPDLKTYNNFFSFPPRKIKIVIFLSADLPLPPYFLLEV